MLLKWHGRWCSHLVKGYEVTPAMVQRHLVNASEVAPATVQPSGECFRSDAGDGFVAVSVTSV